ncbi:hypothetical protein EYC98_02570 [Halieaceae bacterium IMCC14734]|uniref:AlgX/AlgJ SGNH hydrolase-like domain-containing protein n=1 Tax=Candidatus Litorirhabdus singularis TaxID=2518993 RepID=A0ABT3TBV4_9GAMM|nr:hypothetical protein [Candidatus Litorirhabdus singularis]MCX2979743.1 hypothetical protein [Candidatus Litorirhabdus singularis]
MKYKIRIYVAILLLSFPAFLTVVYPSLSGDSRVELRELQNIPSLPTGFWTLRRWPSQFDQFTSDRFPFRTDLIRFIGNIFYTMDISISPEVLIGSQGWLFLRKTSDVLDESRGVKTLAPSQVTAWAASYIHRKEQLQEQGIELLLVIVPNKHTIYPQFMGKSNFLVGPTITDQIVAKLDEFQTEGIVDLRSVLREKAKSEQIYGRYNTHWNDRGAYFGYREIIKNIPNSHQILEEQLNFQSGQVVGGLTRLIGQSELTEESQVLIGDESNPSFEFNALAQKENFRTTGFITETTLTHLPRAIFLCDSNTDQYLYKYLAPSFHEALFVHHKGMKFDQEPIDSFQPNYVVYIIVERLIPYSLD